MLKYFSFGAGLMAYAPEATGRDETAELTRSTAAMVAGLNTIINDIDYLLGEMANKGFAVVADEVRNLASKSDEAAKATKELIESSIASVSDGSQAVNRVAESLERTSDLAGNVSVQMNMVVEAVENQTAALAQVTEGIDQISSVVQTNSATAQESAAASEELSAEASGLKQLVDGFALASD